MKWLIILLSTLVAVHSRPQETQNVAEPSSVELEKQELIELHPNARLLNEQPSHRKIEDKTKEILEKIAEVNKKQGLTSKRIKPDYFHFPFSYSRSQEDSSDTDDAVRESTSFKFPNNLFSNPIFDYLDETKEQNHGNDLRSSPIANNQAPSGFKMVMTNPNAEVTKDDIIPGQYIKRKITHHQTILVPNPMANSMYPNFPQMTPPLSMPISMNSRPEQQNTNSKDSSQIQNLEEQTVDNIKNIVSNSNMMQPQISPYFNPYTRYQDPYNPYYQQFKYPSSGYQLYGPYVVQAPSNLQENDLRPGRQFQWNWPGAQYFPIIIRDPLIQMYNAITSMVEYGPMAGQGGGGGGGGAPCKKNPNKKKQDKSVTEEPARTPKIVDESRDMGKITFKMSDDETAPEVTVYGVESAADPSQNKSYLDIEDLNIGNDSNDPLKFTVTVKTSGDREGKENESSKAFKTSWDYKLKETGKSTFYNTTRQHTGSKLDKFADFTKDSLHTTPKTKYIASYKEHFKQSPPIRDPILQDDEFDKEDEDSDEKAEDISIQNDNNKKLFTRENTGSGIFIHKLKVRKGGVAIAGPGGIATAGSGGTAIVGPNGVAYTHPDSLAIAGSGTKVIAVDPLINLSELVQNSTRTNRTNFDVISSRVGKVVAVGPVIYYNKG